MAEFGFIAAIALGPPLRSPAVKVAVAAADPGRRDAARQVADAAQAELGAEVVNNAAIEPQIRFTSSAPPRSTTCCRST